MKILNKIFSLLIISLTFIACEREYDRPPLSEPVYEGAEPNITIAEFRERFKGVDRDHTDTIEDDLILKATIISSDEDGNIYKTMYVQDETGGIGILVDQSNVYSTYRVGQDVYVQLKGMCASFYGDIQIGFPSGYLYRTPWEDFQEHVLKGGWPDKNKLVAKEITDISILNENANAYKATLVCLKGVTFEDGGKKPFVYTDSESYGTRVLKDAYGNSIDVRTSSYASFASDMLPTGKGNVTAVLGNFNGTWQLSIRSRDDISDFDGIVEGDDEQGGDEPETGTETTIYEEAFATSQGDFTINDVKLPEGSTYVWKWGTFNEEKYMIASAFIGGVNVASESWLISPAINLPNATKATLLFDHVHKFGVNPQQEMTLWISEAGKDNWKQFAISQYASGEDWKDWKTVSTDISEYIGKSIKVAFKYVSSSEGAPQWEIKNFKVTATTTGETGGTVIIPE